MRNVMAAACCVLLAGTGTDSQRADSSAPAQVTTMETIAEQYVRLVLAVGQHDSDYVDAYYGPPDWRPAPNTPPIPLPTLRERAAGLLKRLQSVQPSQQALLRHEYLTKQLGAVDARLRMLGGERLTFDDESRALYDAVAPNHLASYFEEMLSALDGKLPGTGPVPPRYEQYRSQFVIPKDRLDRVFSAAIDACRERTRAHVKLPAEERFTLEYVSGKPWSGYNW